MITMEKPVENKPPIIGEVLENGGIVLAVRWRPHEKGEAEGLHGFILCLLAENFHPFVVWSFVKEPNREILCLNGEYWQDINGANMAFKARSKYIY